MLYPAITRTTSVQVRAMILQPVLSTKSEMSAPGGLVGAYVIGEPVGLLVGLNVSFTRSLILLVTHTWNEDKLEGGYKKLKKKIVFGSHAGRHSSVIL